MKKYGKHIVSGILTLLLISLLFLKLPLILNNYGFENTKLESTTIHRLSGEQITVPDIHRNKIVFFWATWCKACHHDLKKFSLMLSKGEIKVNDFIAISVDEKKEDVIQFIEKEEYQFLVAHDADGSLSRKFKITATPTVLFVNKNSKIDWMSSGVSPMLEKRVKEFLKK